MVRTDALLVFVLHLAKSLVSCCIIRKSPIEALAMLLLVALVVVALLRCVLRLHLVLASELLCKVDDRCRTAIQAGHSAVTHIVLCKLPLCVDSAFQKL